MGEVSCLGVTRWTLTTSTQAGSELSAAHTRGKSCLAWCVPPRIERHCFSAQGWFRGAAAPCVPPALPRPPAASSVREKGSRGTGEARVGIVSGKVIRGTRVARRSGAVTSEVFHLPRSKSILHKAVYRGFKSLGGNQALIPDKTFACGEFCLGLNTPGRTGGKEGATQKCQQPSARAGTRFSMIYSLTCPSLAASGPQKKVI